MNCFFKQNFQKIFEVLDFTSHKIKINALLKFEG